MSTAVTDPNVSNGPDPAVYDRLREQLALIVDDRAVAIEMTENYGDYTVTCRIERGPTIAAQSTSTADSDSRPAAIAPESASAALTASAPAVPRCMYPGCSCKRDGGSVFCADHDMPGVMVDGEGDAGDEVPALDLMESNG